MTFLSSHCVKNIKIVNCNMDGDAKSSCRPSSSYNFSISEIIDIPLPGSVTHLSVTAVLDYCKNKVLRPYLRLLTLVGLRPLALDQTEIFTCLGLLKYLHIITVSFIIILGYVLQYMVCFRRDRGFCYKVFTEIAPDEELSITKIVKDDICYASATFSFIVPSILHLIAYLYAVFIFRSCDAEQLPSLMERVFLASTRLIDGFMFKKKLFKILWTFVGIGIVWLIFSMAAVNILMANAIIKLKWLDASKPVILGTKIILIASTLWHDLIQATVISNYSIQAQLLTSYIHSLRFKLTQYPGQSLDWMREIAEFQKLLNFLNNKLSPPVSIYTFVNICWAISGIIWLSNYDYLDKQMLELSLVDAVHVFVNVLWVLISLAPFIQAARLTSACRMMQDAGHEVRAQPLVHKETPSYELDALLLYASSLRISAKLFLIPVTGKYLCFCLTFVGIFILVLGQCHYLSI